MVCELLCEILENILHHVAFQSCHNTQRQQRYDRERQQSKLNRNRCRPIIQITHDSANIPEACKQHESWQQSDETKRIMTKRNGSGSDDIVLNFQRNQMAAAEQQIRPDARVGCNGFHNVPICVAPGESVETVSNAIP